MTTTLRDFKQPHITEAKKIAERIGADAVVILAFKDDTIAGASYGKTKALCTAAGTWMEKRIMEMGVDIIPSPFDDLPRR